jgi:hypothetical protein
LDFEWGGGNNGMNWVFPLTPAGQYEKMAIAINKAQPGDMPAFEPGMVMALNALKASDASVKHTIVISDGDPSPPTPATVQGFSDAKISVSMIAINPHGGNDISIMQAISQQTGGRYYFPQDPSQLPSIFIKEAKTLKRSMLQNRVFTPLVEFPSPILKGLDTVPQLRGYVLTTVKPRANLIMRAPPVPGEEGDQIDPVLATWRFGLGTTAAWTSDLARNWGVNWVDWEKYNAFVKQLAQEISRVEQKSDLHLRSFASGGQGVITVEDYAKEDTFLDLAARISSPRGETTTVPLKQVAPRRYQATFPLSGRGRYQVMAAGTGTAGGRERNEQALGGFFRALFRGVSALPQRSHFTKADCRAHRRPIAHGSGRGSLPPRTHREGELASGLRLDPVRTLLSRAAGCRHPACAVGSGCPPRLVPISHGGGER